MSDKTIEQIRDEFADKYFDEFCYKHTSIDDDFKAGFDAAIQLCEQRERDLVEALSWIEKNPQDVSVWAVASEALKKHRGE